MKLALIGHPISHSLSPKIYKDLLGESLQYDLLDIPPTQPLPPLSELSKVYSGMNMTSPYKKSFVSQVEIEDPIIKKLGAINTISFTPEGYKGTNTDFVAVKFLLSNHVKAHTDLKLWILGNGSMAQMIVYLAQELNLEFQQFSRSLGNEMRNLNLRPLMSPDRTNLLINACSREFTFHGSLSEKTIFWDLNYNFKPHQESLPNFVKSYIDGQEMLILQAKAALDFWRITIPKLKY